MRRKRKRATSVIVDGVVHAIAEKTSVAAFGVSGDCPLPRRMTRAQRKASKAERLKAHVDPLVRLVCEGYVWRSASRTRAAVNCMSCLVSMAREEA